MSNEEPKHVKWPSITRLSKATVYLSEKIDGTSCGIHVSDGKITAVQSRNQLLENGKDQNGFAAWVRANEATLVEDLGDGIHFGEWAGPGIQKGYGLKEKTFFLFDTRHYGRPWLTPNLSVVPLLRTCQLDTAVFKEVLEELKTNGSVASPGFMRPEGIIAFVYDTQTRFKILCENDNFHKGQLDGK